MCARWAEKNVGRSPLRPQLSSAGCGVWNLFTFIYLSALSDSSIGHIAATYGSPTVVSLNQASGLRCPAPTEELCQELLRLAPRRLVILTERNTKAEGRGVRG